MFKNSVMKKFSFLEERIVFKYMDKRHDFPKHIHDNDYMIGVALKGKSVFTIENTSYDVQEGELCIIPSNTVHYCTAKSDEWEFFTAHPSINLLKNIADSICKNGTSFSFNRYFIKDEKLSTYLKEIIYNTLSSDSIHKDEFLDFLNLLFEKYAIFDKKQTAIKKEKFQVLFDYLKNEKYCLKHLDFYKMAEIMNMNPYYFHRVFSKNIGLTPQTFINALRISKATKLLENNENLASIAVEVGFYDQAHFTKQFKKYYGITPTMYKKIS